MGSISDKLNYLLQTKNDIMNAIIAKGVSILPTDTFRSYAEKISQIVSGGGSAGTGLNEIIRLVPQYIDKPKILDSISAYFLECNTLATFGKDVSLNRVFATFTGSSSDNLIDCASTDIQLRVKYINDYSYNPIATWADLTSVNTNGIWLYGGKIGLDYSVSDGLEPWVDDEGYCYVRLTYRSSTAFRAYYFQDKTWSSQVMIGEGSVSGLSSSSHITVGGRLNDTYFKGDIDLEHSYPTRGVYNSPFIKKNIITL